MGAICFLVLLVLLSPDLVPEKDEYLPRPTYIDDSQWYRWLVRGGKIEPEKIVKAREITKGKIQAKKFLRDAGMSSWLSAGPGNTGGRIRAIALQPDGSGGENIFIGAAGGGIWKSTNNGLSWTANNDFSPSMAITSIVVHPTNSDILYASTGEGQAASTIGIPGAGIFKSTDGGTSWSQLPSTNNEKFYWVNELAVNPTDGNHILAVTSNINKNGSTFGAPFNGGGELYESTDGGATWNFVLSDNFLTDVEFHPSLPNIRLVSGHGTLKVYNSTSGQYEEKVTGLTDEIPQYPGRIEVTISPLAIVGVFYASINAGDEDGTCVVYQSTDSGSTWQFKGDSTDIFSSSPSFGNYSNTIQVDPTNISTIYLGGMDLWKSTNSGASFTKISRWQDYHIYTNAGEYDNIQLHADQHIILPSLLYGPTNKKMYIGNDGGIQASNDISTASDIGFPSLTSGWDNLNGGSSGMRICQFYKGAISPIGAGYGGGAQDQGLQISSTSGWKQPITGDGNQMIFHPTDTNIVYANVNYNSVYRSTDRGVTFESRVSLGKDEAMLIAPMAINLNNPSELFLGGKSLWRYNDITETLTEIKPAYPDLGNFEQHVSIIVTSEQVIWIGYNSGIVEYSTNNGMTWSGDITPFNTVPGTFVTDIDINPNSSNDLDVMISFGGYRQDNIWQASENAGSYTWSNISLNFDMQVNTITHHPTQSNWLYAGTDVGVFASHNNGSSWSVYPANDNYNEGPEYLEVTDLFWSGIESAMEYNLWAATFGRGLFISRTVLLDAYVDINYSGSNLGTRTAPFELFNNAMDRAGGQGTNVTFLGTGIYNEISSSKLYDKPVLIKNELANGTSAIIE